MSEAMKTTKVFLDDKIYRVISVRNGGMGRVWLLQQEFDEPIDPVYRQRLAVKTFDFMEDERTIENELNIWISLLHPSVLPLLKIGRLNYRIAAIMPMLPGSLSDLIEEHGALPEAQVAAVVGQIADALGYAWSTFRLLHLDLKPSNVLLESRDKLRVKVADWGISRLGWSDQSQAIRLGEAASGARVHAVTSYAAGTPLFMAPERFSQGWSFLPSTDIYSLGMMAINLATGLLPFQLGRVDPMSEITSGGYFVNAGTALGRCSQEFRSLCLACVHPSQAQRVSTFDDVARVAARIAGRA